MNVCVYLENDIEHTAHQKWTILKISILNRPGFLVADYYYLLNLVPHTAHGGGVIQSIS